MYLCAVARVTGSEDTTAGGGGGGGGVGVGLVFGGFCAGVVGEWEFGVGGGVVGC